MKYLYNLSQKIKRNSFLKNAAVLSLGTGFAQLITVVTAPILYRIYLPTDYDRLGIYMMVTGLIAPLATLQYQNVIITNPNDEEARQTLMLCLSLGVIMAVFTLMGVFTFLLLPNLENIEHHTKLWLLCAPISVVAQGWNLSLTTWANRKTKYKLISFNTIFTALLVPVVSISLGITFKWPEGLLIGFLVSGIIPPLLLLRHFLEKDGLKISFQFNGIKRQAILHSKYPKYTFPSEMINVFIANLPVMMLVAFFPIPGLIANYNLSQRMLGLPSQLVSGSLTQVFRQEASSEFNKNGNFKRIFNNTFKLLFTLSLVPFALILFFGKDLFVVIFGVNWEMAGLLSQILTPYFFFKFVTSPLSYSFQIAEKQKQDFWAHFGMVILIFMAFLAANFISHSYIHAIAAYSLAYCIIYSYYLVRSYQFSKG